MHPKNKFQIVNCKKTNKNVKITYRLQAVCGNGGQVSHKKTSIACSQCNECSVYEDAPMFI